jgi:hypothetical protein
MVMLIFMIFLSVASANNIHVLFSGGGIKAEFGSVSCHSFPFLFLVFFLTSPPPTGFDGVCDRTELRLHLS